jgi:hypothetical protein
LTPAAAQGPAGARYEGWPGRSAALQRLRDVDREEVGELAAAVREAAQRAPRRPVRQGQLELPDGEPARATSTVIPISIPKRGRERHRGAEAPAS